MRILQVIEFFSPSMGGSAQVAHQTASHLARRGHQVSVWSSDYGADGSRFPEGSFETVLFPCPLARWGFYPTPALAGWARRHVSEFDVIHLHNLRTFQNLAVAGAARRAGVPYVLSAHGSLPHLVERKGAKRVFDFLFGRRLIQDAQRLVAVSPAEAEQYHQAGVDEKRIEVVYNGLDLDEFADLPARGTFRRANAIAEGTRIVLYLGRLHKRKGIDVLIRAFGRIHNELEPCLLLIAGPDDGELARLQALVGELGLGNWVRFTGPLYGEEKLSAYVDADVLASPAVHEIFGLVPFEALMCGTPVIVTDDCGSGRLILEAGVGYVVPVGDAKALAEQIVRALTHREEAVRLAMNGQQFALQSLDWEAIVPEYERMYRELVQQTWSAQD